MKKITFSLLLILGLGYFSYAQHIEQAAAENTAQVFLHSIGKSANVAHVEMIRGVDDSLLAYAVVFSNDYFVWVSTDLRLEPILAFGKKKVNFNSSAYHKDMGWLIQSYSAQTEYAKEHVSVWELPKLRAWSRYSSKGSDTKKELLDVTPLLNTQWDQGCYYNDSCPDEPMAPGYLCGRVPTGCAATAMAQILRYNQYPQQGTGTNSYYHAKYGTQYANFGAANYDYSQMPSSLNGPNAEVAKLMYHCGVSVDMNYGPVASGTANASFSLNAFRNNFNYPASCSLVSKNSYTETAWMNLMKNEIDNGRVMFYTGADPGTSSGHAFVCDGYYGSNYLHFNWGWGGWYDGYFLVSDLTPGTNNFSANQQAIIGLEPQSNKPVAHFSADVTGIDAGGTVSFTDLSSATPTNWQWSFPGGAPASSSLQNPSGITYALSGIYPVRLVVSNAYGTDSLQKDMYIRVYPIADFTASSITIPEGTSVNFNDNSQHIGPIVSWQWSFPGATPAFSSLENPTGIVYPTAGTYSVSLEVSTVGGQDSVLKSQYITVYSIADTLFYQPFPNYYINPQDHPLFSEMNEDFDSLTPYYSQLGHNTFWQHFNENTPQGTNVFFGATSWFNPPGQADNWYTFGPVSIPANGAVLKWKHLYSSTFIDKRDGYEVKLAATGPGASNFPGLPAFWVTDNDIRTENDTAWTEQSIFIDGGIFGSLPMYFAFHHFGDDKTYVFIDDICVIDYHINITSVDEVSNEDLSVYPNPASTHFRIAGIASNQIDEIRLLDMAGRHVQSFMLNENGLYSTNGNVKSGIYFLQLKTKEGKLLIKRLMISDR